MKLYRINSKLYPYVWYDSSYMGYAYNLKTKSLEIDEVKNNKNT